MLENTETLFYDENEDCCKSMKTKVAFDINYIQSEIPCDTYKKSLEEYLEKIWSNLGDW